MSNNVTSVEERRRINPGLIVSPARVDPKSAAQDDVPVRRLTRLDADYYAALDRVATRSIPRPRSATPPPAADSTDSTWLRLLERAVGGWAPTLRGSLAVLAVFVGATILMVLALGPGSLLLAGGTLVLGICLNASGKLPRA